MPAAPRVVSLSSRGIAFGGVDFEDANFEHREYDTWTAYGQSKSANSWFAEALDRFGFSRGVGAFAVHPGGIMTNLARFMSDAELEAAENASIQIKTVEQGAATGVLPHAVDPELAQRLWRLSEQMTAVKFEI